MVLPSTTQTWLDLVTGTALPISHELVSTRESAPCEELQMTEVRRDSTDDISVGKWLEIGGQRSRIRRLPPLVFRMRKPEMRVEGRSDTSFS